ncbi:uncharacterized protein RHOBADRAFT_43921 [Rhodotorula graminis WP1]|uniref:Proteophosphoglycan ppg4 n=1 Tax=Rhodotorula graminis (strain WP1) TaxID=578459 RepID=A0A194S4G7_RHOGW|nr:uncharacterized protein RHOBADRAFT_43921 [Rhodotorula graminis WP1]KPV75415.1 hypothetical protein RHOBADRAFT_43921 [Rhodotorula graminis WP1]
MLPAAAAPRLTALSTLYTDPASSSARRQFAASSSSDTAQGQLTPSSTVDRPPPSPMASPPTSGSAALPTSRLLAPTTNSQAWATRPASVSALKALDERIQSSPQPPPSPALSESGFSLYSPVTPGSSTFHFEAHHQSYFGDEPFTPDLAASAAAASVDSSEARSSDEYDDASKVVLEPVKDHDDREPFPRAGTPPFSPSQASFTTDRLSVQSTAYTDFSTCSPSPSPSIGSVRMATFTRIPMRAFPPSRESVGARSVLSETVDESVEDAPEDEDGIVWDARALARSSMIDADRLPQDLAAVLRGKPADQEQERPSRHEVTPPAVEHAGEVLPKSGSAQTQLTVESWQEGLDAAVGQLSEDPSMTPEEDAMRRMKSILGPKTRIISKAPWVLEDADDDAPLKPLVGRRSFDILTTATRSSSRPSLAEASKEPVVAAAGGSRKYARSHSVNTLLSSRALSDDGRHEPEPSLAGLGIGLVSSRGLSTSDSRRSLRSLKPSPSVPLGLGEPLPDVAGASLAAYAGRATARPAATRAGSAGRVPRVARTPASVVVVDQSSAPAPLASPTWAVPPMSAPPTVSLFAHARALTASDSKASLLTSPGSAPSTSPSPSTPNALYHLGTSPASSAAGSYFSQVPGASPGPPPSTTPKPAGGFAGHRLISLEEARQRESERSAAAQRKAASTPPLETVVDRSASRLREPRTRSSTNESLSSRRGVQSPTAIVTSSPKGGQTPKAIKPKKSGFLKRMMGGGGGDKHPERLPALDSFRPSLPSSTSILSLSSTTPGSSLGKSAGLQVAAGPLSSSTSSGHISFLTAPPTDSRDRLNKRPHVPALSLRPISMAFSAGLPSDFLATIPSPIVKDEAPSPAMPTSAPIRLRSQSDKLTPPLRSAPLPTLAEPLASPYAASFQSSISPGAASVLFDESPACTPFGTATPITPSFCGNAASPPSDSAFTAERLVAVQDEYAVARRAWAHTQFELESQVKALEREVQRLRAGPARACDRCGTTEGGKARDVKTASAVQRPGAFDIRP